MYTYGQDIGLDKIMWDTQKERARERDNANHAHHAAMKPKTFDPEAYYEEYRNKLAIAAFKAYHNESRFEIWDEQTIWRNTFIAFKKGKIMQSEFKWAGEEGWKRVQAVLKQDKKKQD